MPANLSYFTRGTCRPEFWNGSLSLFKSVKKEGYSFVRLFVRDDWYHPEKLAATLYRCEKAGLRVLVTHEFMSQQVLELLSNPSKFTEQTKAIASVIANDSSDARVIFGIGNELTKFARGAHKAQLQAFWDAHIDVARQAAPKHTLLLPAYAYNRPHYGAHDLADLPPVPENCMVSAHCYWPSKMIRNQEPCPWPWVPKPELVTVPVTGPWEHYDNNLQPGNISIPFTREGLSRLLDTIKANPFPVFCDEFGPVFQREHPGALQYYSDFEALSLEKGLPCCRWEGGRK